MTDPQTREEYVELLRDLIGQHSFIQFEIGKWGDETLKQFGGSIRALADEINIGYTAFQEWVQVRRFWLTEGLPAELVERIAMLDEALQANLLNYSHFRSARREAVAQTKDRVEAVRLAVDYLNHILDDNVKHSVMDAEVAAITGGEEFEKSSIVWDSRGHDDMSAVTIGHRVEHAIRELRQAGKVARVVVYAEAANG